MRDRAEGIRRAIGRGEWARARSMWEAWAGELAVRGWVAGEWECVSELYEWSRRALVCERARMAQDRDALRAVESYLG